MVIQNIREVWLALRQPHKQPWVDVAGTSCHDQALERSEAHRGVDRFAVAHGASLCAVRDGESIDTTMGFTPLEGLVMATRSGDVDPGLLMWLAQREPDLADVLDHHSGLQGLAGSGDMRELLARH